MVLFEELLGPYVSSELDPAVVQRWYETHRPSAQDLCAIAEAIGATFVAGGISFVTASGLLNQLMPLADFEKAPGQFWEYYIAFENFETSPNADAFARPVIAKLLSESAS